MDTLIDGPSVKQGHVFAVRDMGGILFLILRLGSETCHVTCRKDVIEPDSWVRIKGLRQGDFIRLSCYTSEGEIVATEVNQIYPRAKQSDSCPDSDIKLILARASLLSGLRLSLTHRGFVEVTLPSIHYGQIKNASFTLDFFGQPARLTTSNALFMDMMSLRLGRAYSIQPCFRAEPSRTRKHLSEFIMLEAGMLGTDLEGAMDALETCIKEAASYVAKSVPLAAGVEMVLDVPFRRLPYTAAIRHIGVSGRGLGRYERRIAQDGPVFVTSMPREIATWTAKPVGKGGTRSFTLLLPGVGETAEAAERVTDPALLRKKFGNAGMWDVLRWYALGQAHPNSILTGFGLGIDRLAMWLFGVTNIRAFHPYHRDQSFSERAKRKKS